MLEGSGTGVEPYPMGTILREDQVSNCSGKAGS